jgi:hypothetical protein
MYLMAEGRLAMVLPKASMIGKRGAACKRVSNRLAVAPPIIVGGILSFEYNR